MALQIPSWMVKNGGRQWRGHSPSFDVNLGLPLSLTTPQQTFFFGGIRHEIRWHKLFEIGFWAVFGDLEGPFRAEDENSVA